MKIIDAVLAWGEPLRNRDFRYLWLADGSAVLGNFFTDIALVLLVYERTQSSIAVGLTLLVKVLSSILFAPFIGAWVDSYSAKTLILISNLVRAFLVVLIPFIPSALLFYVILFLLPLGELLFFPARAALLASIMPKEKYLKANSISSLTNTVLGLVGPALAGLLIATSGYVYAFVFDSFTFLIAFAFTLIISHEARVQGKARVRFSLRESVGYFRESMDLRFGMIALFIGMFVLGAHNASIVVHVQRVLDAGPKGWGILSSAISFGAMFGAASCAWINKHLGRGRTIQLTLTMTGVGLILFAVGGTVWHVLPVRVLMGFTFTTFTISLNTLLQEAAQAEFRGRMFSMAAVLKNLALAVGIGAASLTGDLTGTTAILIGLGILTMICTFAFLSPRLPARSPSLAMVQGSD